MKQPILFINFKTYREGTGSKALKLAGIAETQSKKFNKTIVLVAQTADIRMIASKVSLPAFSQHTDLISFGASTGFILPEAVREAGAIGTVLNHAEHKLSDKELKKCIDRAKESGLIVMACAESISRAEKIASMNPDLIAIEPPKLIGGKVSVSTAKPSLITNSIKAIHKIKKIPVIAGAGIKKKEDVEKAIELGCKGVFVSSGIVKAPNQKTAIKEMLEGMQ
ncbi:MAG: triose-phosphate isomerase [Candidatus Diapherotrites archaeon]